MTELIDSPNRRRVSSKFYMVKVVLYIVLFVIIYNCCSDIYSKEFSEKSIAQIFGTLMIVGLMFLLSRTKTIEYDDNKCILYVLNTERQNEIEIPVEKI